MAHRFKLSKTEGAATWGQYFYHKIQVNHTLPETSCWIRRIGSYNELYVDLQNNQIVENTFGLCEVNVQLSEHVDMDVAITFEMLLEDEWERGIMLVSSVNF